MHLVTEATNDAMLTFTTLRAAGQRLRDMVSGEAVTLIAVSPINAELFGVFYRDGSGRSGARAIIVAPGGLVEQWREELIQKFDLRLEVVSLAPPMRRSGGHPTPRRARYPSGHLCSTRRLVVLPWEVVNGAEVV